MLNKTIAVAVASLALLFGAVTNAHAIPINGEFSLASGANQSFVPVIGLTGATATLGTATGLDFTTLFVSGVPQKTAGVAGQFTINNATEDFLPWLNTIGYIRDFTFNGAGSANYPAVPVAAFETGVGGLVVDLTTIQIDFQFSNGLGLSGTALFHIPNKDATSGTFVLTANQSRRTFSFSASETAIPPVPEPVSLLFIGVGLVSAGLLVRRRGA